jgi:hypothetical protein
MPIRERRPRKRSRRLCALLITSLVLTVTAAALPSSASAYQDHFCQWVALGSGADCWAGNRHTLQAVTAYSIGTWSRVCAASWSTPWGGQNSDWRCDYQVAYKYLGGRVDGVGVIHNGDPLWIWSYGTQDF